MLRIPYTRVLANTFAKLNFVKDVFFFSDIFVRSECRLHASESIRIVFKIIFNELPKGPTAK